MTRTTRWTALATLVLLAACQQQAPEAPAAAAPAPADPTEAAPATSAPPADLMARGTPAAAESADSITRIVNLQSIDATKEFLERTLGQSKYETPDTAQYVVAGCNINLVFAENKAVSSVSIDLTKGCRFDASGLTQSEKPVMVDGPMTFAQFEDTFGQARYTSPCLTMCGNAFDPYVAAVVPGYSANRGIDVAGVSVFVADAVSDASNVWQTKLTEKAGEDYVIDTKFNCEDTHNDIPRAAFAKAPVETLQFGRDLNEASCE